MSHRIPSLKPLAVGAFVLSLGCNNSGNGSPSSSASVSAPPPADWSSSTPTTIPSSALTQIDVPGPTGTAASVENGVVAAIATPASSCYPHLFERTYEVTDILNNHTNTMMARIAGIVAHPKAADGSPDCSVDNKSNPTQISCTIDPAAGLFDGYPLTLTWEKSTISTGTQYVTNVYIQSSTTNAANLYQCELSASASSAPTFGPCTSTCPTCTTIFSATLDLTTSANGFELSSPATTPMNFDFTSLNAVDPSELATGSFQVNVDFARDTTKPNPYRRVLGFTFVNFVPALTAAEIAAGEANHGARNGTLAHIGYTGSPNGGGGAMEFVDEVILFCPAYSGETATPTLYSDALTVGRWYQDTATNPGTLTLYGRVDAEAVGDDGGSPPGTTPSGSGGGNAQLPSGTEYIGAVCYSAAVTSSAGPIPSDGGSDPYMFVEETGGTTVEASTYQCGPESTPGETSTCATSCGKLAALPTVSGSTISNAYSFNGLVPNLSASGIPTDPASIETALAPLLCGTGIGTAWTGQPNCP